MIDSVIDCLSLFPTFVLMICEFFPFLLMVISNRTVDEAGKVQRIRISSYEILQYGNRFRLSSEECSASVDLQHRHHTTPGNNFIYLVLVITFFTIDIFAQLLRYAGYIG